MRLAHLTVAATLMLGLPSGAKADGPPLWARGKAFGDATVTVTERFGVRGGTSIAIIGIRGDGETTRFSARVQFDPAALEIVPGSIKAVAPATCQQLSGPEANLIEVSTLGSSNTAPYVDSLFCEVQFRIRSNAAGGFSPLTVTTSTCRNNAAANTACKADNGFVGITSLASLPNSGGTLVIAGRPNQTSESRLVILSNLDPVVGGQTLTISQCAVTGDGFRLLSPAAFSIAPSDSPGGAQQSIRVECDLPASGQTRFGGQLSCQTSDVVQTALQYNLACASVPDGEPLPSDQVVSNELRSGDQFGTSVAAATDGGTDRVIAVGAPFAGSDGEGRIYVLAQAEPAKSARGTSVTEAIPGVGERLPDVSQWQLVGVLGPSNLPRAKDGKTTPIPRFGAAVGFSRNRNLLAIGSPGAGTGGAVQVFQKPVGGWQSGLENAVLVATIPAPPTSSQSFITPQGFGAQVAFNDNGDLVVGAPDTDTSSQTDVGQVYLYPTTGTSVDPASPTRVGSPGATDGGRFGQSIAVDDDVLVVGAPNEAPAGQHSGAAYMVPLSLGAQVGQTMPIIPATRSPLDNFGAAVGIQGTTIVIGAPGATTTSGEDSGQAVVFDVDPNAGETVQITTLLPAPGAMQGAGAQVTLNNELVVVGAPEADSAGKPDAGIAYVFDGGELLKRRPTPVSSQRPKAAIENRNDGEEDRFGRALAIDGRTLLVGAPTADLVVGNTTLNEAGRADPFVLEVVFRSSFE